MRKLMILLLVLLISAVAAPSSASDPSWCLNRSNSYCTYALNKMTACCYATYTAPGAGCPTICQ